MVACCVAVSSIEPFVQTEFPETVKEYLTKVGVELCYARVFVTYKSVQGLLLRTS